MVKDTFNLPNDVPRLPLIAVEIQFSFAEVLLGLTKDQIFISCSEVISICLVVV